MDQFVFWLFIISMPIAFYLWLSWVLLKVRLGVGKKIGLFVIISIPWLAILQKFNPSVAIYGDEHWSLYYLYGDLLALHLLAWASLYYLAKRYFQRTLLRNVFCILSLLVLGLMYGLSLSSYELTRFKDSKGNSYYISADHDGFWYQAVLKRRVLDLFLVKLVKPEAGGLRRMSHISMPIDGEEALYSNFVEQACPVERTTSLSPAVSRSMSSYHWLILESDGYLIFNPRVINGQLEIPLLYNITEGRVLKGYEIKKLPDFSRLRCIFDGSLSETLNGGIEE